MHIYTYTYIYSIPAVAFPSGCPPVLKLTAQSGERNLAVENNVLFLQLCRMAGGLLLPGITGSHTKLADLLGAGLPFSPQGLGLFGLMVSPHLSERKHGKTAK